MEDKIKKILKTSTKVIEDCSLKNGAIVASNIFDSAYPKNVKNYNFVWPRDASFVCVACDLLDIRKIPEKFFDWCWKAEQFKEKGIFYMRYHPNGKMYGMEFQPDQTGLLLWAIENHSKKWNIEKFSDLVEKAANGIYFSWNGKCFRKSYDIWEEIFTSPKKEENFTYSLAMCIMGLKSALNLIGEKKEWIKCRNQMMFELEKAYDKNLGYFLRKSNDKDYIIDSSMLGLVWPSGALAATDERISSTIRKITEINEIEEGGIIRYVGDRYAGNLRRKEAGSWPILNFWMSIYFSLIGNREKALEYFYWVMNRVEDKLPEQIKNGKPSSIIPLVWSHAMFVISGKFLNLF